jgi:hypothetical protein
LQALLDAVFMALQASGTKRRHTRSYVLNAIVEATIEVESARFNPLKVSNHTKLEPRDTHFTAQASFGDRTRTVSVVDVSVTLIQPHKAYMSRRYGTVVKVEEDI